MEIETRAIDNACESPPDAGSRSVALLEEFVMRTDTGGLFHSGTAEDHRRYRDAIHRAVITLLDDQRPFLESEKGILWPYHILRNCTPFFEDTLKSGGSAFQREQALLYLARLPFPGQWKHLVRAEDALRDQPEIAELLRFETDSSHHKIRQRAEKAYRIRRFCQILKRPRLPGEKGILRIFSLLYLFTDRKLLAQLGKKYILYVEPTAGVMCRHTWLRAFSRPGDPSVFGVAGPEDTAYIKSQPGVVTTRLAHADFLQDDIRIPAHEEKRFDLVFIGTFDEMRRKRHMRLLSLMRHPKLSAATALVIGQGKAENIREFIRSVNAAGISDRVTVLSNRPRKEIPEHLARCRIGVHLALHENGCRCIYEYFRSDLPCVISSYTAGVNFKIFNPQTGVAVPDRELPEAIRNVLENRKAFSPRRWFLSRSGSANGSKRLNRRFKKFFSDRGYDWTEDIVPLSGGGANRYVKASHYERFRPEFHTLLDIFTRKAEFPVRVTVD